MGSKPRQGGGSPVPGSPPAGVGSGGSCRKQPEPSRSQPRQLLQLLLPAAASSWLFPPAPPPGPGHMAGVGEAPLGSRRLPGAWDCRWEPAGPSAPGHGHGHGPGRLSELRGGGRRRAGPGRVVQGAARAARRQPCPPLGAAGPSAARSRLQLGAARPARRESSPRGRGLPRLPQPGVAGAAGARAGKQQHPPRLGREGPRPVAPCPLAEVAQDLLLLRSAAGGREGHFSSHRCNRCSAVQGATEQHRPPWRARLQPAQRSPEPVPSPPLCHADPRALGKLPAP